MRISLLAATAALTVAVWPCRAQIAGAYQLTFEGCPDDSLLYETFAPGSFDLNAVGSLDWVPNGRRGYTVFAGSTAFLPTTTAVDLGLVDEQISTPQSLLFNFPYPTGLQSTNQIEVSSNGYVYLEPGTITSPRCCSATPQLLREFFEDAPSWAVLGMNLDPTNMGAVYFDQTASVAWVTWENVPEWGQTSPNNMQIQFHASGQVSLIYGASVMAHTALVGWSGGNGVDDDGPFDFSAGLPHDMGPSYGPLTVGAPVSRVPTLGQPFTIDITRLPPDAVLGAVIFGASQLQLSLTPLGMTGCDLLVGTPLLSLPAALNIPARTGSVTLPLPAGPQFAGAIVETQAAVVSPTVNPGVLETSNRGSLLVGDLAAPVIVRAEGADNFNSDDSDGFWKVINASTQNVVGLRLDWVRSSIPNTTYFDTNQTGMADRFDGGGSNVPLCMGTYRNGSDVDVGLDYTATPATPCGAGTTGWVGSNFGRSPGDFRTLDFKFNDFNPGEVFEFDVDTDTGPGNGGAMEGLVVTVTFADGTSRTGELKRINNDLAQVGL